MTVTITEKDILRLVENLMKFPFPTICRHAVASGLLSMLEEKGWPCPANLAEAVVKAEDQKALDILKSIDANGS